MGLISLPFQFLFAAPDIPLKYQSYLAVANSKFPIKRELTIKRELLSPKKKVQSLLFYAGIYNGRN
jgi:hypothetical protein